MMKNLYNLCFWLLLIAGCTTKKIEVPEGNKLTVQMATEGVDKFENYIHSLSVYAFQQAADGSYVYHSTLAELDSAAIAAMDDYAARGNTKVFRTELARGRYRLFFVGNAAGRLEGNLEEGVTLPQHLRIKGDATGEKKVFFLGQAGVRIVSDYMSPVSVTLSRAVGKLLVVLNNIPSQLDSVRLSLGNLSESIGIDGSLTRQGMILQRAYGLKNRNIYSNDTAVFELLAMPSVSKDSPFKLIFRTENGQEKTKEMPSLQILPDKYIRIQAYISNEPGALLSFDVAVRYWIFDYWQDLALPDFPLKPGSL